MVTNYPRQLVAAASASAEGQPARTLHRVATRVKQTLCGLTGHDAVLHFEGKRVMMRCTSCGHHTPGLEVTGGGPRRRFEGDPARHRMGTEPHLVLRKSA